MSSHVPDILQIMVIEILSLVTAMLCLVQFYHQYKEQLASHQPVLKFLATKLVVFLFYVQSFILSILIKTGGSIKPSLTFSYPSWAVGLPNAILCVEMAAISVLHLWAYPYRPYYIYPICLDKTNVAESSTGERQLQEIWHQGDSPITNNTQVQYKRLRKQPWWRGLLHVFNLSDFYT